MRGNQPRKQCEEKVFCGPQAGIVRDDRSAMEVARQMVIYQRGKRKGARSFLRAKDISLYSLQDEERGAG